MANVLQRCWKGDLLESQEKTPETHARVSQTRCPSSKRRERKPSVMHLQTAPPQGDGPRTWLPPPPCQPQLLAAQVSVCPVSRGLSKRPPRPSLLTAHSIRSSHTGLLLVLECAGVFPPQGLCTGCAHIPSHSRPQLYGVAARLASPPLSTLIFLFFQICFY